MHVQRETKPEDDVPSPNGKHCEPKNDAETAFACEMGDRVIPFSRSSMPQHFVDDGWYSPTVMIALSRTHTVVPLPQYHGADFSAPLSILLRRPPHMLKMEEDTQQMQMDVMRYVHHALITRSSHGEIA
jgi:hypothetical protein